MEELPSAQDAAPSSMDISSLVLSFGEPRKRCYMVGFLGSGEGGRLGARTRSKGAVIGLLACEQPIAAT